MAGIPWDKIRTEWLKGGITQAELAAKYNVKLKTIQNRASNEGWGKQKGIIREQTEEQINTRIARARANHLEKLINIQEDVLESLAKLAEDVKKNPKMLISEKGEMRNAESLTRAIQTATLTQRDLYGLRNIDQKFAAKKWKEEQKLQRELKAQKDVTEQTGQMVVYIHPPTEEQEGGGNE